MPNDTFTMAKFGPTYVNTHRVDLGRSTERIIAGALDKEHACVEARERAAAILNEQEQPNER